MIVAPVPILGRKALFPWTCHRLIQMGIIPLCIVESNKERYLCERYNWPVKQVRHMALGQKWNIGFEWARAYDPHAVLYVGSSDWVSDNWIDTLYPLLEDYDMVGAKGVHFYHRVYGAGPYARSLKEPIHSVGYWKGYTEDREGESAGGGRLLSKRILELIDYKPFRDENYHNMDYNMMYKVATHGGRIYTYDRQDIKGLAISTDLWGNMHKFEDIDEIKDPEKFLEKYFPEALELWNVDGVYSQIKK